MHIFDNNDMSRQSKKLLTLLKPFLALPTRPLTLPSFTVLAVLVPDFHTLTYVKQQDVALPLAYVLLLGLVCLRLFSLTSTFGNAQPR